MGIASGVLWIVFGLLYVLYQAIKERPDETLRGAVLFFMILSGICGFYFVNKLLISISPYAGIVWIIGCVSALIIWAVKSWGKEKEQRNRLLEKTNDITSKAREIVWNEEYTDEEIDKYAQTWMRFPANAQSKERFEYVVASTPEEKAKARLPIIEAYRRNVRFGIVAKELMQNTSRSTISENESSGAVWGEE